MRQDATPPPWKSNKSTVHKNSTRVMEKCGLRVLGFSKFKGKGAGRLYSVKTKRKKIKFKIIQL